MKNIKADYGNYVTKKHKKVKTLIGRLLFLSLVSASASFANDAVFVANETYIDDVYGFVVPIPSGYTACAEPPIGSEHGFLLIPRIVRCRLYRKYGAIGISGFWSMTKDATSAFTAQAFCGGGGTAVRTKLRLGTEALFGCSNSTDVDARYFTLREFHQANRTRMVAYGIEVTNIATESGRQRLLGPLLAEVRFLSE